MTLQMTEVTPTTETTLDPEDWDGLRELGHRMLDDMFEYLRTVRERPVWRTVPPDVRGELRTSLPREASSADRVYDDFKRNVLPYPTGNTHPRFWGWVMGNGTPLAMLADMLASGMNTHLAGYDQAAAIVEHQVLAWLAEMLDYPVSCSGVLTNGGTIANIIGLTVARNSRAGFDVRGEGLRESAMPLAVYCSTETHSWIQKGVELLGLGDRSLHRVGVDDQFRIDLVELRALIRKHRSEGVQPLCVIGTAGTVNTGATDDLAALADLCREEGLWLHVDAAFGAFAKLSPTHRGQVEGMERADSIAFDLHKWMYLPFGAGCALIRDPQVHKKAFAVTASYLTALERGIAAQPLEFAARGIDLSRSFLALKIWFSLKVHGVEKFTELIDQNIRQAAYLRDLIVADPNLELLAPVPLNVVCFRFVTDRGREITNRINQEIVLRIQESGFAVTSSTMINGDFAIRVANTNHRSTKEDFAQLAERVVQLGREIVA